jgi:TonB family protein
MYFTSNAVGANHIWRQRFPDGKPEQFTAGPTEEQGIAMAPDGRSFVTAVSLQGASLWLHDSTGERQISVEGNAATPKFTSDGSRLLYRLVREQPNEFDQYRDLGEVIVADLKSGRSEPLVRGFQVVSFDTKRSRKNRKSEKQGKGSPQKATQVASSPKTITPIAVDPPSRVADGAVPRGTIVESEIELSAGRRGKPVVRWLAVAAVALASIYLVSPRGDSNVTTIVPAIRTSTKSGRTTPPVVETAPVASAPTESIAQTPQPLPIVPDSPKPAPWPVAVKVPAPKKSVDRVAAPTPGSTATVSRKAAAPVQTPADGPSTGKKLPKPEPGPSAPTAIETAVVPPPVTSVPSAHDTNAAGVEALSDSAPTTKVEPGKLIPIDEADTLPVPLTHRSPFYSTEAIQMRVSGTVSMNVLINDHGTVDQVVLVTGVAGGDVNDAAIRAAKSWTYRPATKSGVPVKVWRSEQVVVKP